MINILYLKISLIFYKQIYIFDLHTRPKIASLNKYQFLNYLSWYKLIFYICFKYKVFPYRSAIFLIFSEGSVL